MSRGPCAVAELLAINYDEANLILIYIHRYKHKTKNRHRLRKIEMW